MESRHTIIREGTMSGAGLHTACKVNLRFLPASDGGGIRFRRTDLDGCPVIPASIDYVDERQSRRTVLCKDGAEVQTVEHLLAACAGQGIHDLVVEIDGPEVPSGDGSSEEFIRALSALGRNPLPFERKRLVIERPVMISEGDCTACAVPSRDGGLSISYVLMYDNPLLRHQTFTFEDKPGLFAAGPGRARTFCMEEEVEVLRKAGFGKGANVDNTVVVARNGGVHGGGLRFEDECARHKVLDLLGDLSLAGAAVEGAIFARKSGHRINHMLVKKIVSSACGAERPAMDINEIRRILPHRYPFLLVDRVIESSDDRAVGVKNVSADEDFFQGHFPGEPLMPGVLQVEAMAQLAGVILLKSKSRQGRISLILSVDAVRFRRTVRPGDRLVITVSAGKVKSRTAEVSARAEVDGRLCTEAVLRFIMVDED